MSKSILDERQLFDKNTSGKLKDVLAIVEKAIDRSEPIHEVEGELIPAVLALGKACLENIIKNAGDGNEGKTIVRNGKTLKRSSQKHRRAYQSVFGVLEIQRYVYAPREKQKIEAYPLDEKLGLPSGEISYVLEDWLVRLTTDMPYDPAVDWLKRTLGINVSSTTAEQLVRKVGDFVVPSREQCEPPDETEEGDLVVVSADGKGIPIRRSLESRLKEETGKKPHLRRKKNNYKKSSHRRVRGDKPSTQRVIAGACYTIDRQQRTVRDIVQKKPSFAGPTPQHKRLWGEMTKILNGDVSKGSVRLFQELADEVALRNPQDLKPVICIMDGDPGLWNLLREYLPQAICIIDLFHVLEKLWSVAHCFHRDASLDAEKSVARYLTMLLEGKVDHVRGVFQRFYNRGDLSETKKDTLAHVIKYFKDNRDAMRYDRYIKAGYPIGSGVIEGACKHVIGDRFCGGGMRWEIEGAQPLLDLRTTQLNGEWDAFINYRIQTEQEIVYHQAA
jgi:hypothetical protein